MENMENRYRNSVAEHAEFWKGVMLGTMAGMVFAAVTYEIVDRVPNELEKPKPARVRDRNSPLNKAAA
jgi:hypothetical protein